MVTFFPQVYVLKRPYVDEFLEKMGELFECVLFTASLAKVNLSELCFIDDNDDLLIPTCTSLLFHCDWHFSQKQSLHCSLFFLVC